jgi:hypothetical protein
LPRVPDALTGKDIMNSKTDEGSPTQPPKPRKSYYEGKKLLGLFRIKPGETVEQFAERVCKASNEALAKHRSQQFSAPSA